MSGYDRLYALVQETEANITRLQDAAAAAREHRVRRAIPGRLGTVTVSGNGGLIAVDLDRRGPRCHSLKGAYNDVGDGWDRLRQQVTSWKLADLDLGVLGKQSGVVHAYNTAVDTVAGKLAQGKISFDGAEDSVGQVAKEYLARDEEYYAKFGWTKNELGGRP